MKKKQCNFCGSSNYEKRTIDYVHSHKGKYLLVSDTPVDVCLECGMIYYDASVLKGIEKHFFDIQNNREKPKSYIQMPQMSYV